MILRNSCALKIKILKESLYVKKIKSLLQKILTDYTILLRNIPSPTILFFVLSVVCANLMANKELVQYKYLALDCGFVFSWIMFLCMDIICKRWGAKASVKISLFALLVNLFVCLSFFILTQTQGYWAQAYSVEEELSFTVNTALNKTFGGSWFVVFGSTIAFLVSSIVNALINALIGKKSKQLFKEDSFSHFALRSYTSTFFAQFTDNFIFATLISRQFFGWSWQQILLCSLFGATCELLCEVFFSGIGFKILQKWEAEKVGEDYLAYRKNRKEQK